MSHSGVVLKPIGFVKSERYAEECRCSRWEVVSEVVIMEEYEEGLEGIEDFSHLFIIYLLHKRPPSDATVRKVRPRGDPSAPLVGVFATRSPVRPNPLALSVVRLLKREGNRLLVKGLDAFDGSPVLDVKPYDLQDLMEGVRVPDWWMKFHWKRGT